MASLFRGMETQNFDRDGPGSLEEQFVKILMERKRVKLAKREAEVAALSRRDVVLQVTLPFHTHPRLAPITRRLRCSAGTKLSVFQDKILSPVMGWERNLHSYVFIEYEDGAMFGTPKNSSHIDNVHSQGVGDYAHFEDEQFTIAHLISKEGDAFQYLYDFGDKFYHEIKVIELLEEEDSTGEIVLLEGNGACPGENMQGNDRYGEVLMRFIKGDEAERTKIKAEILECPNYSFNGSSSVPIASFNPVHFSIIEGQKRLSLALSSPNSRRDGAKMYSIPLGGADIGTESFYSKFANGRKGTRHKVTETGGIGSWTELKSTVADLEGQNTCQVCGKGAELSKCSGCRRIWYCSADHQKSDWMFHKTACRKAQAARAKAAAIV
ncbi:MM3350-like domain-containing protein [Leucosporidium creatinivorum]|uniref:MM3350-like domain-containing protein n=1 Tax=Leucosporidium creatinivorum TaxID=106004 RepID=A0A1Y2FEJ6_9BASI|nr:MM3350-like domain-containing protein [Leucosporidium creatinivorum]